MSVARSSRVASALVLLAACADADDARIVSIGPGPAVDAALPSMHTTDAGVTMDASVFGCIGDELTFETAETSGVSFAAAVDGNDVRVLYLRVGCDGVGLPRDPRALWSARFATTGAPLTAAYPLDDHCRSLRQPALLTESTGAATAYFTARADEGFALHALALDADDAGAREVTQQALNSPLGAALLGAWRRPTLAYVPPGSDPSEQVAASIVLRQDQHTSEVLPESAQHHVAALTLLQAGGSELGTLLWLSDRGEHPGIYLRAVDSSGAAAGPIVPLTQTVGAHSAVGASAQGSGAGIVYTEPSADGKHKLRFRRLETDGGIGEPVSLPEAGDDIAHPSIAAYRNGYAIGYRWLGGELNRQVGLRLLFVDEFGKIGGERALTDTTLSGSAAQVLTARDGRLVVLWDALDAVSPDDAGVRATRLHVLRQTCQ